MTEADSEPERGMGGGAGFEDATLLALKMEEGAMSPGMQVASRSCKTKETSSLLEPPEGTSPADVLVSGLQNCQRTALYWFTLPR